MWVLIVFSKEYTIDYTVPVKYNNFPAGKVVSSNLPDKFKLSVKGSGFNLFFFGLNNENKFINIDVSKARFNPYYGDYTFDTRHSADSIAKQLHKELHIVKLNPDNITFKVKNKSYKLVPVKLKALISYANQFQLNGNITINPSLVKISGDSAELLAVNEIETESLILRNLNKSVSRNINLKLPVNSNSVQFEQGNVILSIPVEKFTEASILTPIAVDNVPRGFTIKTFPDRVKLTYQVSLSRYNTIKEKMFSVRADYNELKNENGNKLKVNIVKTPEYIRNPRLEPDKVEFILKKL